MTNAVRTILCAVALVWMTTSTAGADAPLNVLDFGAVGDGTHDDTTAIQQAVDAAIAQQSAVYLPRGAYAISEPIEVHLNSYAWGKAVRITGDWPKLIATQQMETMLDVRTAAHLTIERLTLDANGQADHGFKGFKLSTRRVLIDRVAVENALSHGFVLEKCQGGVFRGCAANRNEGDGWYIADCNAAVFQDCMGVNNKGNGFTFTRKDFSSGCVVNNVWSENNDGHGILVDGSTTPVAIRSGWVEGNGRDGVRLAARAVVVRELLITGGGDGNRWAIHLTEEAEGCIIENNSFAPGPGDALYARVRIDEGVENYHVQRNLRLGIHDPYVVEPTFGPPAFEPDVEFEPIGSNLVADGMFQSTTAWSQVHQNVISHGAEIDETRPDDVAYRIVGEGATASVTQTLQLEPGERYRLSGWVRAEHGQVDLAIHNGHNLVYRKCRSDDPAWMYQQYEFTAAGHSSYVRLIAIQTDEDPAVGWFDDIELVKIAPVE